MDSTKVVSSSAAEPVAINNNVKLWTEPDDCGTVVTTDSSTEQQTAIVTDGLPIDKQIAKLKRFLETIYNFSCNFSTPNTGGLVRKLIEKVIVGELTPNEFVKQLQGSTTFHLRPFVIPFLQNSLPLLREQYKTKQERTKLWSELFDANAVVSDSTGNGGTQEKVTQMSRKRKPSHTVADLSPPPKWLRSPPVSDAPALRMLRATSKETNSKVPLLGTSSNNNTTTNNNNNTQNEPWAWCTDDWRQIETLFTSLVSTMDRLRYAMILFQQRARLAQVWSNHSFQRRDADTRIEEIQKRADATVKDVKRIAILELQKAVSVAEEKAQKMVATEREQMERNLRDAQTQEEKIENCWNCGRKAGQACSDCSVVRYCGTFCQHRDWPRHRLNCAKYKLKNDGGKTVLTVKTETGTGDLPSPKSV